MKFLLNHIYIILLYVVIIKSTVNNSNKTVGLYQLLNKFIDQCNGFDDVMKCIKIQGIKIVDNALKCKRIDIIDGVSIIKANDKRIGRNLMVSRNILNAQNSRKIDFIFWEKINEFINGHKLQLEVLPLIEEARRKKGRRYIWPLVIALGVKTILMVMSYQSVAVMSGAALILGKIAILLSAILGLKKLVSGAQDRTTTLEIVKHPQHSHSHIYSNSHEDDYYHRNYDVENDTDPQRKAYNAYIN